MCARELAEVTGGNGESHAPRRARVQTRTRARPTRSVEGALSTETSFSTNALDARPTRRAKNADVSSQSLAELDEGTSAGTSREARREPAGAAAKAADDACLGASADASWMIPAVILVVTFAAVALYLLSPGGKTPGKVEVPGTRWRTCRRAVAGHAGLPGARRGTIRERSSRSGSCATRSAARPRTKRVGGRRALLEQARGVKKQRNRFCVLTKNG